MVRVWQFQEVEDKFREVVDAALSEGPQIITKSGVETAIVLSYADYRKLLAPRRKLSDSFQKSPLVGVELDLTRDPSPVRSS